ncbi:MAG TPA: NADH-quinone oxidoreductase subunit C [Spirochaetota bacterium]|nr:NADH-quinone oxidoreductase subunit C [Spirochaetota bacterium]
MGEVQKYININPAELLNHVADYSAQGYRLVQIGCTMKGDRYELNYSFDKDYGFVNLRFDIAQDYEVASISPIYFCAFLYENEIHELFGVMIKNIVVDYKGSFYRVKGTAPFRKSPAPENEPGGEA